MRAVRLALAQVNLTVGALEGNCATIRGYIARAKAEEAAIVAFPELAVTGYPPEDLVLRRSFCEASTAAVESLIPATAGIVAIVGFVDWDQGEAWNAAAVIANGRWVDTYHKQRLPNYGVFDEERYFATGTRTPVYEAGDFSFGVSICEDIWYPGRPLDETSLAGAELCININGSPYHRGKALSRERMLATRAADNLIALAYVNLVGGQDEVVFDGASMVFDAHGPLVARAAQFEERLVIVDVDLDEVDQARRHDARRRVELREREGRAGAEHVDLGWVVPLRPALDNGEIVPLLADEEEVWKALVSGTGDYLRKTTFHSALIALSGGIDSSVVAALAVDALGPGNVVGVSMPSRYSSDHSRTDAKALADNLGIRLLTIPIEPAHAAMLDMLADAFEGTEPGTAE
ncbi:MAG: nitrilase-related carbon-nitrogen hydrolase, partial [Dehalococcoidia bacterium]